MRPDYAPALTALGHEVQAGIHTLARLLAEGMIPQPSPQQITIPWYAPEQIEAVRQYLDADLRRRRPAEPRPEPWVSIQEVSRRAGVRPEVVRRAVHQGVIPPPGHRINTHMRYAESEVEPIVLAVRQWYTRPRATDRQPTSGSPHDRRRAAGLASRSEVSKAAGVAPITHQWHERQGRIPRPTHQYPECVGLYYDLEDQVRIRQFYQDRPLLQQRRTSRRYDLGLRSRADLARESGISRWRLADLMAAGLVPQPKTRGFRVLYYRVGPEFDAAAQAVKQAMTN